MLERAAQPDPVGRQRIHHLRVADQQRTPDLRAARRDPRPQRVGEYGSAAGPLSPAAYHLGFAGDVRARPSGATCAAASARRSSTRRSPPCSGVGQPPGGSFCGLFGTTTPLTDEQLDRLYPSEERFVRSWKVELRRAVAQGFILPADARLLETAFAGFDPGL